MEPDLEVLTDIVCRGAMRHPDGCAVQAVGGSSLSYLDLSERVERSAGALRRLGLAPGDRVLLALDGSPEWAVAFFGLLRAGLVVVPVPGGTSPEVSRLAARYANARACLLGIQNAGVASTIGVPCLSVPDLLAASGGVASAPDTSADVLALLVFTSGSTGRPRAVELTHGNLLANLRALTRVRAAAPGEAILTMVPPAHLFGLVVGLLAPLAAGVRVVFPTVLLPNRLLDAMRADQVTRALAVPALVESLCREVLSDLVERGLLTAAVRVRPVGTLRDRWAGLRVDRQEVLRHAVRDRIGACLHTVGVGGAALAPGWADVLGAVGIDLDIGYGLTEAGPLVSLGLASQSPAGSVGRPLPGVDVRASDTGEILVRGPSVMRGYLHDPASSVAALEGGWLHTGDRGRLDERGFLYVTGRSKEAMVTAAGETVYPDEVEPHYACPLFAEHCVVPVSGLDGNDVPTLVVVMSNPTTEDAEAARVFARLRAAAPARCRVAKLVRRDGPLPRTPLGKLRRRQLADALGAQLTGA